MIEFRHVSKIYKKRIPALDDVSFRIEAGEFVFLVGESGAGKSTLIKLLTCEERPSRGRVILDNFNVSRMRRQLVPFLRRRFGMIFQDFRLIESKTVAENVAFAMQIVGAPKEVIQRRVPMVLSVVGLKDRMDAYPSELSGGEAQRVGIARAMINNPRLILADEPTGNLDPANSEAIMALLEEINRVGTTVIACTHDVALVDKMKKRVIELRNGRVVRDEQRAGYMDSSIIPSPRELAEMDRLIESSGPTTVDDTDLDEEKQDSMAEFNKMRDKLLEDQERRRNRESLAERIARMRKELDLEIAAMTEILPDYKDESGKATAEKVAPESKEQTEVIEESGEDE